jgi:hypothetical protein
MCVCAMTGSANVIDVSNADRVFRTCASALYTLTYAQLMPEFHVSREVATLGLSLFVAGLGLGPMVRLKDIIWRT